MLDLRNLGWIDCAFLNCGVKLLVDVHVSGKSKEAKLQSQDFICDELIFFLQQVFLYFFFPFPSFLPTPFNWQRGLQFKHLSLTKQSAEVDATIILLCV